MLEPLEARIAPSTLLDAFRLSNGTDVRENPPSVIGTDSQGNLIVAGRFYGGGFEELPFGAFGAEPVTGDLFIAKFAADDLSRVWIRKWGGTGLETPRAIAFDAADNIYVTGSFAAVGANFDGPGGGISAVGIQDAFVFKLNADGSAANGFGTGGNLRFGGDDAGLQQIEEGSSIVVDSTGAVIVAGVFNTPNAGFGGPTTVAANGIDGFLFKVDGATGAPVVNFGNGGMIGTAIAGEDRITRAVTDSSNDLYVTTVQKTAVAASYGIAKRSGANGSIVAAFNGGGQIFSNSLAPAVALDVAIDNSDRVVAIAGSTSDDRLIVSRLDRITGALDPAFAGGQVFPLFTQGPAKLNIDSLNQIYVSGNDAATGNFFVMRVSKNAVDEGTILSTRTTGLDATIDPQDRLILRGAHAGNPDLDPTGSSLKLPARAGLNASMTDGYVVRVDPYGIDAANPLVFRDDPSDTAPTVTVNWIGPGRGHYSLVGGTSAGAELDSLQLIGTTLQTRVSITASVITVDDETTIGRIFTTDTAGDPRDVGSITLGANVILGRGVNDAVKELLVSGRMNALTLGDLSENTLIQLGTQLVYDLPGNTASDTYNNRPTLTIDRVLGADVEINVLNTVPPPAPGEPAPVGGGGFGNIIIGSWEFAGFLRTTQSIGNFTVLGAGDTIFRATLEIDAEGVGSGTTANTGNMNVGGGGWGSSGSEVEGTIASFSATAFLASATLTAADIGRITVGGPFEGTLNLTSVDPDSSAIPTFTVHGDVTGGIVSTSPIRKLKINGDFRGSLEAPFIGSISAYAFIGTTDMAGNPTKEIKATNTAFGSLGTLTATQGGIADYKLITTQAFKGIKVNLTKLNSDTVGLDNVQITAASIGNIFVSLKADKTASDFNLVGIRNSDFTTTSSDADPAKAGRIGNVTVAITGAPGGTSAIGMQDVNFDALVGPAATPTSTINSLGNISVKLTGQGGINRGLDDVSFTANSIGKTTVSVNRFVNPSSTAAGMATVEYIASGAIGAVTVGGNANLEQVNALKMWAGESIGAVTVKSTDAQFGTLKSSAIFAGQILPLTAADLALAKLGAVNVSGSIIGSGLAAGGSIGAITAGKNVTGSLILAGVKMGAPGDFLFNGNETYQGAAAIAAVTVKGNFAQTSIAAGVDPGGDLIFGNGNDVLAPVGFSAGPSRIGPINLPQVTAGDAVVSSHQYAIEAAQVGSLKALVNPTNGYPAFLDQATPGDDSSDVVVRVIT